MMTAESTVLFNLAKRVALAHAEHPLARAAMVSGSVAKGIADHYSDIDMSMYYRDGLPEEEWLAGVRTRLGAAERKWLVENREEGSVMEAYLLNGVEVQIVHTTIAAWNDALDTVLVKLDVESPLQKALEGTLACVPLFGAEYIEEWKARAGAYPDALAEAMVRRYMNFFPLWGLLGQFSTRDATVWYYQILAESAQNIIGVLAGLNHLYFTTFQFKRMGRLIREMAIAPADLANRLERLFRTPMPDALCDVEALVAETLALVCEHMPQVDTAAASKRIGWRQEAWGPVEHEPMPEGRTAPPPYHPHDAGAHC
ncbi:MAG: hypothetical protein JST22_12395 [Bacteroidetes bacterium]|nr:hypothetical protein [Bacteroidota bacterium]